MKPVLLISAIVLLLGGCLRSASPASSIPTVQVFEPESRSNCFNGVGFFRVAKGELDQRLPPGFRSRDGSLLGRAHAGFGLVALIYYSCPRPSGADYRVALIATPIEDPSLSAELRAVRWNWYEFARLVDSPEVVGQMKDRGFSVQAADLSHRPFREGATVSSFSVTDRQRPLLDVRASLTDSVNFQAQSHRYWHQRADGRLVTTRLDFAYHHSWIGRFASCTLNSRLLTVINLSPMSCSGEGITEAIETLNFTEQVILWR